MFNLSCVGSGRIFLRFRDCCSSCGWGDDDVRTSRSVSVDISLREKSSSGGCFLVYLTGEVYLR